MIIDLIDGTYELLRHDKTGQGIEPALLAQFHALEEALAAMGVVVWPMVDLEADDALGAAARIASEDERVDKVLIWTPGTKWMFSPREDIAMVLMTQRYMASELPYWPQFKRLVRGALVESAPRPSSCG